MESRSATPATQPQPAATAPAPAAAPVRRRSHRLRWTAALAVVLVVAVVSVAGAFLLSGAGGTNKALTADYAPANTAVFFDIRADLPGDQHQKMADFMSHFPGFQDRAQFNVGFEDILNRLTGAISPDFTYAWALRGWTTGEVSLATSNVIGWNSLQPGAPTVEGVVLVAVKDRAAGEEWVASEVSRTGIAFTAEDYAGTKLYVSSQAQPMAYAFTDRVLAVGDPASVRAALDAPRKGSLAHKDAYLTAMKSLSGDSVATFYMDPTALLRNGVGLPFGLQLSLDAVLPANGAGLPAWLAGSVRAESDRINVEIKMPHGEGKVVSGNRRASLAADLPGSTVGVLELHSVGSLLESSLASAGSLPSPLGDTVAQVQSAVKLLGGLGWIGDSAVVVTDENGRLGGGVVVKTADADTAAGRKALLANLVTLGGSQYGLTASDETYKGTTITIINVPQTNTLPGNFGAMQIGLAVKGDLLFAGYGDEFAKQMIDTTAESSLAGQPDFKAALSAVGESNSLYGYWNFPATIGQIFESQMSVEWYRLNYKPYVENVGGSALAVLDGETVIIRLVVTAR